MSHIWFGGYERADYIPIYMKRQTHLHPYVTVCQTMINMLNYGYMNNKHTVKERQKRNVKEKRTMDIST